MSGNGRTMAAPRFIMGAMTFRISGLDPAPFASYASMSDEELARYNARRYTANEYPGFPCRVTLDDAQPGEEVILLNFEHLPVDSPYRSSHAIYVRTNATRRYEGRDGGPARTRAASALGARLRRGRADGLG